MSRDTQTPRGRHFELVSICRLPDLRDPFDRLTENHTPAAAAECGGGMTSAGGTPAAALALPPAGRLTSVSRRLRSVSFAVRERKAQPSPARARPVRVARWLRALRGLRARRAWSPPRRSFQADITGPSGHTPPGARRRLPPAAPPPPGSPTSSYVHPYTYMGLRSRSASQPRITR